MQPKCVQTPTTTSHSLRLTRVRSFAGSMVAALSSASARAICASVRCTMNTGLPCHRTVMAWPGLMCVRSTSAVASALVSADGSRLCSIGQIAAAAPCAGNADGAYRLLANLDLQRAGKCDDVAQVDGPERRVVFQSLGHLARGDAEGA